MLGTAMQCGVVRCRAVLCSVAWCCAVPLARTPPVQLMLEVKAACCCRWSSQAPADLRRPQLRGCTSLGDARPSRAAFPFATSVSERAFVMGPLQPGGCGQAGPGRSPCRPQAPCSSEGRGRAGSGNAASGNAGGAACPLAVGTPPRLPGASSGLPPSDTAPPGLPGRCWHRSSLQALQTAQGKNFNSASDFNLKSEKMEKE